MIGGEKLLLNIGVPALHQGRPLSFNDINFLGLSVTESWNGEKIGQQIKIAAEKVGHDPLFVITDNASVMSKGVRCSGLLHLRDISHSLGMYMERVYRDEDDFKEYLKLMTAAKFKYNMKKIAYLLPPNQRTIARFMNLSEWVRWSTKILESYSALSEEEQTVFSFVPLYKSLINELSEVVKCVNMIEFKCKNRGLSRQIVNECKQEITKYLYSGNKRMVKLGESIDEFLEEQIKSVTQEIAYNNSSDIVESIFGKFKARISPNKLNGVTTFILFLPICAKLNSDSQTEKYDFKGALEGKRMAHIENWKRENLTPNLAYLRTKILKKTA